MAAVRWVLLAISARMLRFSCPARQLASETPAARGRSLYRAVEQLAHANDAFSSWIRRDMMPTRDAAFSSRWVCTTEAVLAGVEVVARKACAASVRGLRAPLAHRPP